jgi:hypothetical protein
LEADEVVAVTARRGDTFTLLCTVARDADVVCDGLRALCGWQMVSSSIERDKEVFEYVPPSPPPELDFSAISEEAPSPAVENTDVAPQEPT